MPGVPQPPRLARWILRRALPADSQDHVSADVEEMYRRRGADGGHARARLWFWRQAFSFIGHFLAERMRRRPTMTTGMSWMDVKLAVRMLVRYPGLTLVGVLGMAVGLALAAGGYGIIDTFTSDALPLPEGNRIVTIQNWDAARNSPERHLLHDFAAWRDDLKSVGDLGAFRQLSRNLILPGTPPETVRVAEMSAAGFRVARIPPLVGRALDDQDERDGAPPVVVIDYQTWMVRFQGDPNVTSRTLQLGSATYAIVGVMPDQFAFPVNNRIWIPLKTGGPRPAPLTGPVVTVFGRLAPGATLAGAQAELATIGLRTAAASPATHGNIRPRVLPYTYPFFDIDSPQTARLMRLAQYLLAVLLVVVSVNVAILVYARTATRGSEIAIRTALGASRQRIVAQLFAEALVLSAVATLVGLAITAFGLARINAAIMEVFPQRPFWWVFHLSRGAMLYVVGLTVLAAGIVGVVPALKATGRRVQNRLQNISAGGGAGMQLGRTWTVLIVAQVAFAVALLPGVLFHAWSSLNSGTADPGFPAREFLTAQLAMERAAAGAAAPGPFSEQESARYGQLQEELARRLTAEPQVAGVTFALALPGQEMTAWVDADGVAMPTTPDNYALGEGTNIGHMVRFTRVALDVFDVFQVPVLTGRTFRAGDAAPAAPAVVVNRAFVQEILGGGNALGRRLRYVGRSREASAEYVELGRWYEVVGVVADFPATPMESGLANAKVYHAAVPGSVSPMSVAIRLRGSEAASFAPRLRAIAAEVDPNLQLVRLSNMDELLKRDQSLMRLIALGLGIVSLSVVVLCAAGIYALMSFTVARRRKEIGIRAALGAEPGRILRSIFSRAATQLAVGAVAGILVAAGVEVLTHGELMEGNGPLILPIVAVLMMMVGLLAAVGPARRGLRIQPTEALREE